MTMYLCDKYNIAWEYILATGKWHAITHVLVPIFCRFYLQSCMVIEV